MTARRASLDLEEIARRDMGELRALIKAMRTKAALDKLDAIEGKLRTLSKDLKGAN